MGIFSGKVQYDTETMRSCADRYEETAARLLVLKDELQASIDTLVTTHWRSKAGEAFSDMYNDTWADGVIKYTDTLTHLAQLVRESAAYYDELSEEAGKLSV